jgi:hypothetical protein
MVTDFRLKDGDKPITVDALIRGLNTYLDTVGLRPEQYGFYVSSRFEHSRSKASERMPEGSRWLIAFTIEGSNEGYFILVGAIDWATNTYTELGFGKSFSPDHAYAVARETQRFLRAAEGY